MLILKIIGFSFLGILALLLLILLSLLFVPVVYKGEFIKQDKEMRGSVRVSWFLGLITLKAFYEDKRFTASLRAVFKRFDLDDSGAEKESDTKKKKDKRTLKPEKNHEKAEKRKQEEKDKNEPSKTETAKSASTGKSAERKALEETSC